MLAQTLPIMFLQPSGLRWFLLCQAVGAWGSHGGCTHKTPAPGSSTRLTAPSRWRRLYFPSALQASSSAVLWHFVLHTVGFPSGRVSAQHPQWQNQDKACREEQAAGESWPGPPTPLQAGASHCASAVKVLFSLSSSTSPSTSSSFFPSSSSFAV